MESSSLKRIKRAQDLQLGDYLSYDNDVVRVENIVPLPRGELDVIVMDDSGLISSFRTFPRTVLQLATGWD